MKSMHPLQAHEIELIAGGRKPDPELTDHPQPDPYSEPQRYDQICPATDPEPGVPV